jgi:hypothetical protein
MRPRPVQLLLATTSALFFCGAAEARTIYVTTTGADTNDGSQAAPYRTIEKAASVAVAGDTVIVAAGTYAGARFSTSGTAALPITVTGEDGAIVNTPGPNNTNGDNIWVRNASYVIIQGFEVRSAPRAGIAVQGEPDAEVHGVVLRNNYCHNNTRWGIFTGYAEGILIEINETSYSADEHGIYVSNSADNPIIRDNRSHHNAASGIQINADPALDGDGIITNALVDSNICYENGVAGGAAINLASVVDSLIINNLLYSNHASGIAAWDDEAGEQFGSHHNRFFNNTIVQASDGRFALSLLNGSSSNGVYNNVLLHFGARGSIAVDSSSEFELESDNNMVVDLFEVDEVFMDLAAWQARGHEGQAVMYAAGTFANLNANDYHLPDGSVAIDTGRYVTGFSTDIEDTPRPQGSSFDIGAYEYAVVLPPGNDPPVANAGPDQTVDAGADVLLDGSGSSDPNGDVLSFNWTQISGPTVNLVNQTTAMPSFVAPELDVASVLEFQLVVDDNREGVATDLVVVNVRARVVPPPRIFVITPAGGEGWRIGKKKKIQWTTEVPLEGDVRIEVSRDGGATFETAIAAVPAAKGKKKWTVTGPVTTNAIIRILYIPDPRIQGQNSIPFTIRPPA